MKKYILIGIIIVAAVAALGWLTQESKPQPLVSAINTNWIKHPANPVIDIGSTWWDKNGLADPSVIFDGEIYKMWYSANDGDYSRIGYATSEDGINWKKIGVALDRGAPGSWEDLSIDTPHVIVDEGLYKMWYAAYPRKPVHYNIDYAYRIGYATSEDGINWVKHPDNPVLTVSDTELVVADPTVARVGNEYKMWYSVLSPTNLHIAYATSSDGARWTKYGPVLTGSDSEKNWDYLIASQPFVLFNGKNYEMWYGGGDSGYNVAALIGYAASEDGINWKKNQDPVLDVGSSADFDYLTVNGPAVIQDGEIYKLWYAGGGFKEPTGFRIGLATLKISEE